MKTVGRLVHAQVIQVICRTHLKQQQPNNVVNPQEITNWFVNVPMVMVGMEDILKSMDTHIANNLAVGMRKKNPQ